LIERIKAQKKEIKQPPPVPTGKSDTMWGDLKGTSKVLAAKMKERGVELSAPPPSAESARDKPVDPLV